MNRRLQLSLYAQPPYEDCLKWVVADKTREGTAIYQVPRPCKYSRCRQHLERNETRARTKHKDRRMALRQEHGVTHTCAIDVANEHPGGLDLDDIAEIMGVSRERVRQIEQLALCKMSRCEHTKTVSDEMTEEQARRRGWPEHGEEQDQ
jgi:hypothetical protein